MSNIHKHLKVIRTEKGLTQDEVADRIGLTRQAISGYESGKRQPGIDILMKLAETYEVDLESILYGKKESAKQKKAVQYLAITVAALFLSLQMLMGLLITFSFTMYPLPNGIIPDEYRAIIEKHFEMAQNAYVVEWVSHIVLSVGSLLVMALDLNMKHPFSWKKKVVFYLLVLGASWLTAAFWGAMHPKYGLLDFVARGPIYFIGITFFLMVDLAVWGFRKK